MITVLTIPEKVPSNNGKNGLLRMHWTDRKKLCERYQLIFMSQSRNRHLGRVTIHVTHYYIGSSIADYDNLVSTLKIPLDAIRKIGIIVDDHQLITGVPTFEQIRVKKEIDVKTVIIIKDINHNYEEGKTGISVEGKSNHLHAPR